MSEYALTPRLGLYKPTPNADVDLWGSHLNYNADKLDSRVSERLSATDFGIICDGVTDQGAQINAALTAMAPGATLYIPGPVYTTQTIALSNGRKIEMPPGAMIRPAAGSNLLVGTIAIIGSINLSPVVQVTGNEGGLTNVWITRNGTPPAGSIGLQCYGQDQVYWKCRFYNHAIGARVGGRSADPAPNYAITTSFDHCQWWNCTEDFIYLVCAPETSFYDCRWGINGSVDPPGATALVTIDGDNGNQSAAGTNTLTFLRCQFNTGGGPQYSVRFTKVDRQGVYKFIGCYSGGAAVAFFFIDPNCGFVQGLTVTSCTFQPLSAGETFLLDTGKRLNGLKILGCEFGPVTPASFTLSGIGAVIVGNTWFGPSIVQLDAMAGGCFVGNSVNTLQVTGAFTGAFTVAGNAYANITQTATGTVYYAEPQGNYGSQLTVGKTGQGGRVDFRRGQDGAATAWIGMSGATLPHVEIANTSGTSNIRLNATLANVFMISGTEVSRVDAMGHTIARASGNTAPGAGFARLAFVNGTTAGTAKLVAYAGTSTTPTTILDNIGTGF